MPVKDRKGEAIAGFLSDFPSLAAAKENLTSLGKTAIRRSKDGKSPLWYYAAISSFRNPITGKHGRWYDDVLPGLFIGAGWFETLERAQLLSSDIREAIKKEKARKCSESNLSMTRQETKDAFMQIFPSLESAQEDLAKLSPTSMSKINEKFLYGANAHFKDPDSGSVKWYETILPNLVLEVGWFDSKEDARKFAARAEEASKESFGKKISASRLSMSAEEVVDAFKKDFPSLEDAKKDPLKLSKKALEAAAKKQDGHWYYPACNIFAKKKSWYAGFAVLMMRAGWFQDTESAKKFANEIAKARRSAGGEIIARARRNMSEEEVIAAFLEEFPSLEEARKDLTRLGESSVKDLERKSGRRWATTSLSLYKKPGGRIGRWYENALPNIVLKAGWFDTNVEAIDFANEVKAAVLVGRARKQSRDRRGMSKEEILDAFKKDFPSLEAARKDLFKIGAAQIRKKAENSTGHWYYPARSLFKPHGKKRRAKWYEDMLPNLTLMAGWFETMDEANAFSKEVRDYCNNVRNMKQVQTKLRMSESEILKAFREEFKSLEELRKDLTQLGCTRISGMAEADKGHWYFQALCIFRNPENGKRGRWYRDVLPNLVLKVDWFDTLAESYTFSKQVQDAIKQAAKEKLIISHASMNESEVIDAFSRHFPSLEEARKDLTRLSSSRVRKIARNSPFNWFGRALSLYRNPETGRLGKWYEDVLPNLVFKSGWFETYKVATEFCMEVKEECKAATARKIARSQRDRRVSARIARNYAIVVERLKREANEGASFDGISKLLNIESIASDQNNQNGIARAVIASQPIKSSLSPAEILRFKMSTGNWSGEMAEAYAQAFSFIAPYLTTRLLMLHVFMLFKEGKIQNINKGASFLSGPGEVYHALQDLKDELQKQMIVIPSVIDVDAEKDMLDKSGNPNKLLATLPNSSLASESMDFVECSSLYQFNPRKEPTIVKDVILEAKRVLKENGTLILTSTAKRFSPEFGKALQLLGFDIVTPANTRLKISEEAQNRIEENMGEEVLRKANEAARDTYFLVAVKTNRSSEDVSAELFRFEKPKTELPEEAKSIAKQARSFTRKLDDSEATQNIERMANILENLSPDTHLNHAELIQSVLSKYMLDQRTKRPDPDEKTLRENASRILNDLDAMNLCAEKDRYFITLRRMAKAHTSKLKAANSSQKIKQK